MPVGHLCLLWKNVCAGPLQSFIQIVWDFHTEVCGIFT